MNADDGFIQNVEQWVERELRDPPSDFASLVKALPGVDPILVFAALNSVKFAESVAARAMIDSATAVPSQSRTVHCVPVPHPLDYDWRYSPQAISTLTKTIAAKLPTGGGVGLIGAPTLARPLTALSGEYSLHLFDRNPLWQSQLPGIDLHTIDVSIDSCPPELRLSLDLVVVDPPWYDAGYACFMWFARTLLSVGGILALSVLPLGTRPSAASDRDRLRQLANELGFELLEQHSAVLGYATPPFEANALRAAGIKTSLPRWRFGDLWLFSAVANAQISRPTPEPASDWRELSFDEVRIKFDIRAAQGTPELVGLVDGDVFPSVSARFPGRERASVWTSGNRAYACANSLELYRLCRDAFWHSMTGFADAGLASKEAAPLSRVAGIINEELGEYGNRR